MSTTLLLHILWVADAVVIILIIASVIYGKHLDRQIAEAEERIEALERRRQAGGGL